MRRDNTNREKVLQSIRNALLDASGESHSIDMVSNVFQPYGTETEVVFAEAFTAQGGDFIYCADEAEFLGSLSLYLSQKGIKKLGCVDEDLAALVREEGISLDAEPENPVASITTAELLVARTGSVIVSSARQDPRPFVYPDLHIVLAFASQVRPDLQPAIRSLVQKYQGNLPAFVSVISGSSFTLAVENRIVRNARGPGSIAVFMVDDKSVYA